MKFGKGHYLVGGERNGVWDLVPSMRKDLSLRRAALVALVADGCPRAHITAALKVSEPTLTRDVQALRAGNPDFGTMAWRLRYHEREAEQLRRALERGDDEALGN